MLTPFVICLTIASTMAASGVLLAAWQVSAVGAAASKNSVGVSKSEEIAGVTSLPVQQSETRIAA